MYSNETPRQLLYTLINTLAEGLVLEGRGFGWRSYNRATRKPLSLICHCGHPYHMHHNAGIKAAWAEECCAFRYAGNENGGLNTDGSVHCQRYIDNTLPR